ncbi:hypothetical protein ABIB73_004667 [Bradyrhizobium sp. F1.4.3]|uniref:hypothetical protein n=1 Tax=Bradyrhizobium sp. F1.4.3 TaxID=3156356 RepID=UPI003397ACF1
MADDAYAIRIKGGAVGLISANAIWTMPAASPTATPIRQAMLYEPSASEFLRGDRIGCPSAGDFRFALEPGHVRALRQSTRWAKNGHRSIFV